MCLTIQPIIKKLIPQVKLINNILNNPADFLAKDNHKFCLFSTIASHWDEASKLQSYSLELDVEITMPNKIPYTENIKNMFSNVQNPIQIICDRVNSMNIYSTNIDRQNKTFSTSVNTLCGCLNSDSNEILDKLNLNNLDGHHLYFNIKRSADYAQVQMVNLCNNKRNSPEFYVFNTHQPDNVFDVFFVLITFDKLCFMKAINEECPCIFVSNKKGLDGTTTYRLHVYVKHVFDANYIIQKIAAIKELNNNSYSDLILKKLKDHNTIIDTDNFTKLFKEK